MSKSRCINLLWSRRNRNTHLTSRNLSTSRGAGTLQTCSHSIHYRCTHMNNLTWGFSHWSPSHWSRPLFVRIVSRNLSMSITHLPLILFWAISIYVRPFQADFWVLTDGGIPFSLTQTGILPMWENHWWIWTSILWIKRVISPIQFLNLNYFDDRKSEFYLQCTTDIIHF